MRVWRCPSGTWDVVRRGACPGCPPGVLGYRGYRMDLGRPRVCVQVPDGLVSLVLGWGEPLRVWRFTDTATAPHPTGGLTEAASLLVGPMTRAVAARHEGHVEGVEIALAPWAAYRLFGGVVGDLVDGTAPLADLAGGWATDLAGSLTRIDGWPARFALLDAVLGARIAGGVPCAPQVVGTWELLYTGRGLPRVGDLARRAGWSPRHLQRRFRQQIGLAPKETARMLRLSRAASMLAAGVAGTRAAVTAGFFDQAHLWRDFAAATGCPPGRFFPPAGRPAPVAGHGPGVAGTSPGPPPPGGRAHARAVGVVMAS